MTDNVSIEVCVDSVASAIAAERGGAARLELCSGLVEGGITPSSGLIERAREATSLPLHVIIRPRGGDFRYDSFELEVMQRDIAVAKRLKADGVVFGILEEVGSVDISSTRKFTEMARPLSVTFHRAFDMTADLSRSLETLCTLGIDRVLTSGGKSNSLEGAQTIAELVRQARGRMVVMAGSGIKPDNARALVQQTGVKEIHVGLRTSSSSPMRYRNPGISMGSLAEREYQRFGVLEDDVRKLCSAVAGQR